MGAKLRQIRRRTRSVQSTKKITKAMELVAASRIVRAERRVRQARPFSDKISQVIKDLAATTERLEHPLLERRDDAPVGLIVVTADRGLAGAYNANILRAAELLRRERGDGGVATYALGRKAVSAYRFRRVEMTAQWAGFSDTPSYADAAAVAGKVMEDFSEGRIGSAQIVYTRFVTIATQRPETVEILPVHAEVLEGGRAFPPVFEFEPEPTELLGHLLPAYVEMKVFHALLEAAASEHASRRRAMSAATENADEVIRALTRELNSARQQEITMEIADIVGGTEALRKSMAGVGS